MSSRQSAQHYVFVLPALAVSLMVILVPAVLTFAAAFTQWDGISQPRFIGTENFSDLFSDRIFWKVIGNNIRWALMFLTIPVVISLIVASVLASKGAKSSIYQLIFLLPYVLSPVANAVIWQNIILDPVSGLVGFWSDNFFPIANPLTRRSSALYAVAAVDMWHFWGYLTVVFLAAIRQIPTEQLEAAYLEGANGWQLFRHVTLPNILPTVALMLVLVTIFSFLTFDYVYLLTQGGPARATEILATFSYKLAFTSFQVGKAAAVAMVISFFGLIASFAYVWLSQSSLEV